MRPDPFRLEPHAPDLSVRPAFRVVGAILLLGVAALFVSNGIAAFSQEITTFASCAREGKGRLFCELGKLLLTQMPSFVRGPVLSGVAFVVALGALLFGWWLLRPLFGEPASPQPAHEAKRSGTQRES